MLQLLGLQPKLKIGAPGDRFEKEADQVAEVVNRAPYPGPVSRQEEGEEELQTRSIQRQSEGDDEEVQTLRRQAEEEETPAERALQRQEAEEEESVQAQGLETVEQQEKEESEERPAGGPLIQRRMKEGGDLPVRARGMAQEEPLQTRAEEEEMPLQAEAEEEEESLALAAKGEGGSSPPVPKGFSSQLRSSRGEGTSLGSAQRAFFESQFGRDFGSVRVHTGIRAENMNRSIRARAFTRGSDIYFSPGRFAPESSSGRQLLAHELTHVVQQGKAPEKTETRTSAVPDVQRTPLKLQRQEATVADRGPSEEEKAAALAAAAAAEKQADQAAGAGRDEIEKSRVEKQAEEKVAEQARQDAEAVVGQPVEQPGDKGGEAAPEEGAAEGRKRSAGPGGAEQEAGAEGAVAAGPEARAPASPEEDPAFQSTLRSIRQTGTRQRSHAPATSKAQEAQAAAVSPPKEIEGKAQTNQVGEMEAAEVPPFDAAGFKAKLKKRIAELAPKTLSEADDFKQNNKLGAVKEEMQGQVSEQKQASRGPLAEKTAGAPDTSVVEPKQVTPIPPATPGGLPPPVGADRAAPKAKSRIELEQPLQESGKSVDQQMQENQINEEQLAKSNEPAFTTALESKKEAQTHAQEGPQAYRQFEQEQFVQTQADAKAAAAAKTRGMFGARSDLLSQVVEQQGVTKSKDELARQKVGLDIQKIYDRTKVNVEKTLQGLDERVTRAFDDGAAVARQVFENYVQAKMEAYKERRYGGWLGWARWAKDKLLGMPSEVNAFYQRGRDIYLAKMNAVIDTVVEIIGAGLTEAKAEIARGKREIKQYVDGLPENLKSVGAEAAQSVQSKFDQLEASVDSKQNELIDALASKYREGLKAVDARIEELKAANQGLVQKAINAVAGVIKTIIELKNKLMKVLAKAAGVILQIMQDPIGFLGNLVKALKQGFQNFVSNIGRHLQAGFIAWLTGAMGPVGIKLPKDVFSLKGIFSLVMQVLGLSWDYIRAKAVKLLGEPVVKALETGFKVFQILAKEGVAGLWAFVKEKFNDLKEMVIEKIKEMLITQVIKAGIKWLLGLLNPVAAFIKAAIAIYEIVKFIIEKADQIIDFISSIVDAVIAIARGSIGGAAKLVEDALAKSIPLIIGFLASLLGISGLAQRVQDFIKSLRKRFEAAIDSLILKAKKFAGKLMRGKKGKALAAQGKFTEKDRKQGLAAFEKEEKPYLKKGGISRADALKTASTVKKRHPVFKSIKVVDGKDSWDYEYVFRAKVDTPSGKAGDGRQDKFGVTLAELERRFRHRLGKEYVFALVDDLWTVRRGASKATETAKYKLTHKGKGSYGLEEEVSASEVDAKKAHDQVMKRMSASKQAYLKGHGRWVAGHAGTTFTTKTRDDVDEIGYTDGDHSDPTIKHPGTSRINPATKYGKKGLPNWVPDHQPPDTLLGGGASISFRFYPHSDSSRLKQGGIVRIYKLWMKNARNAGDSDWAKGVRSEWFW